MGERYLIDTNIAVYYLEYNLPDAVLDFLERILNQEANLSIISKIELLVWEYSTDDEIKKIKDFIKGTTIFLLDNKVAEKTVEIRKNYKLKLPDAIIAATAIVANLILISRNDVDFEKIHELKYINPFKMKLNQ